MQRVMLTLILFMFMCITERQLTDATICKPLSTFKIDCKTCFCSTSGDRYVCTRKSCRGEPDEFEFVNDEGYDDFVIPKKSNDYKIPYINDEIPPSRENWDEERNEYIIADDYLIPGMHDDWVIPGRYDVQDKRFVQPSPQDMDNDVQDAEEIGEISDDYRFKREIFI